MIRWFRSVASFLRRLLWPMPKDLDEPAAKPVVVGVDPAGAGSSSSVVMMRAADGEWQVIGEVMQGPTFTLNLETGELAGPQGEDSDLDDEEPDEADDLGDRHPEAPNAGQPPRQTEPGRQALAMPGGGAGGLFASIFGDGPRWAGPAPNYRHAPWEALHTFLGGRPRRDEYGLHNVSEPLSLVCPACELEQPPLKAGERACPYCGLRIRIHGTHAMWWRPEIVPALQWPPAAQEGQE